MPPALQPAACFGKTPRHGDFVRYGVGDALRAFDRWAGRAVYEGRRHPAFDGAYDAQAVVRFVYAPPRAAVALVGAMCPSRDRSGRRYPFIVAAEAPGLGDTTAAPARLAPFFDEAARVAADAAAGDLDHYDLVERLRAVDAAPPGDGGGLGRRLGAFGEGLWGDFEDARKLALFRNLRHVLRGAEDGFRFPLGLTPGADARVWLAVVERMGGGAPSAFAVYEGGPAVGSPNLIAYTGAPHPNALLHLLVPGAQADGVVELEARETAGTPGLPDHVGALLADRALPLADLLRQL